MRLLIDSHVLPWVLLAPERLPRLVGDLLLDPADDVLVSIASAWEVAIKRGLGRLTLPGRLDEAVSACGSSFLPITAEHCGAVDGLPPFDHRRKPRYGVAPIR
jgi:PIN domain nuclease of toxin-antitoxin system